LAAHLTRTRPCQIEDETENDGEDEQGYDPHSDLFEIARVLVDFDHVTCIIINADHNAV
jgi:hypothetical protein